VSNLYIEEEEGTRVAVGNKTWGPPGSNIKKYDRVKKKKKKNKGENHLMQGCTRKKDGAGV